jgi:hypothetical protein
MKKITLNALIAVLTSVKGATFASVKYTCEKQDALNKGRKKGETLLDLHGLDADEIVKESTMGVFIGEGTEYEKLVNNRLKKEGKAQIRFEGGELPYGEWIVPNLLLDNGKGDVQLRTYVDIMNDFPATATYTHKGVEINPDAYPAFWTAKYSAKKEGTFTEGDNQGTERTIKPRNIFVRNIREITLLGETYELVH